MKYLRFLGDPISILLIILFLAIIFLFMNRRRLALILMNISFWCFVGIILFDPGQLIFKYLEDRFPKEEVSGDIAGFIILGGIVDSLGTEDRGQLLLSDRAERLTVIPEIMHQYPQSKVIFTGAGKKGSEGKYAVKYLNDIGFDGSKLLIEGESTTTQENALFTSKKYQPKEDENWYLVTSAWHMPRSIGVFKKMGWQDIKPWPVDYMTGNQYRRVHRFNVGSRFYKISLALREIAGLTAYYFKGITDEWIPKGEISS
ncbi:MAG: YdcF family protein [Alphaproteobacteria bacterium]